MEFLILIGLIIVGGIVGLFTNMFPVKLVVRKIYDANKLRHQQAVAEYEKAVTAYEETSAALEAAEYRLQELGTENENLQTDLKVWKNIGDKAGDFVEEQFRNILTDSAAKRLLQYDKQQIVNNFKQRISTCVQGLKTIDFSRM